MQVQPSAQSRFLQGNASLNEMNLICITFSSWIQLREWELADAPRSTNFVLICNYVIIYFYYYFECEVKESNEYENSL